VQKPGKMQPIESGKPPRHFGKMTGGGGIRTAWAKSFKKIREKEELMGKATERICERSHQAGFGRGLGHSWGGKWSLGVVSWRGATLGSEQD